MTKRLNIEHIREVAESKGIKLLSNKYVNNHTKLKFECGNGHTWDTTWKSISRGGGNCPTCYWANPQPPLKYQGKYKEERLEEVKKIMEERGGRCLSTEYKDNFSKLLFVCDKGHKWESNYKSVITMRTWCPVCLEESYSSIEDLNKIAESRGGKCLSKSRGQKKLEWECCFGHRWRAVVSNIVGRNSWCPECSAGLYENICRLYFETLFGKLFTKAHPKWLTNSKGNRLELDGYCEELKLAFEHNGRQHYIENTIYHHDSIQQNDLEKKKLCEERNIVLIVIPELFFYTKIEDLKRLIIDECNKCKIDIPFSHKDIDYEKAHFINKNEKYLKEAKSVASKKGGECLSNIYINSNHKLTFKCENGHTWETTLAGIRKGWCPECSIYVREIKTIQDTQELAELKNGQCLSTEYVNNHTKMTWQCEYGHIWEASYNTIQSGCWCPQCGIKSRSDKQRLSIEVYKMAAEKKGGECLSAEYNNCFEKLTWKCGKGHIWKARADQIKNTKQWCPYCSGRRKWKVKSQ